MLPDISQGGSPEHSIHNGVEQHICIRVTQQAQRVFYLYTAQDQIPPLN
jgi:hypothetical protein